MIEKIIIGSLEDYIKYVEVAEDILMFRGMSNIEYKLIPSVGRYGITKQSVQLKFEQQLLNDFKRKAPLYMDRLPNNDYEWLFLAQHHGLPTRLLDWTFNPIIALFFAVENNIDKDSCVYSSYLSQTITPENIHTWGSPFEIKNVLQIIPTLSHVRYQNQNGLFTVHPEPSKEDTSKVEKQYIIPKAAKPAISWKLRSIGITKSLIFPSLDSLSYDIYSLHKSRYQGYFYGGNG